MHISKRFSATLVLSTSLFIGACSGGDDTTIKVADLCAENSGGYQDFVDKLFECAPEFELFVGSLPSAADVAAACESQFSGFSDDGTIEFGERDLLNDCLDAIESADCLTFEIDDIPECDDLVVGTLDIGTACEIDDQCAGDAYCSTDTEFGNCGVCTATLADGQSCDENSECSNGKCRSNGTCGSFSVEDGACEDSEDCVGQLVCSDDTCQAPAGDSVGDDCTEFTECGFPFSGLFCNEQTSLCEEFLALGDDCFDGVAALGVCDLLNYETCDFEDTAKCIAPTIVELDEPCNFSDGTKCSEGLVCENGETGVCREPGEGSACNPNTDSNTCGLFLECKSDGVCGYENEYSGICPEV